MVRVGFIGLGLMGEPMALNIAAGRFPLVVWNRSSAKTTRLRAAGANVATVPDEVFASCGVIVEMLADEDAINTVFGLRGVGLDRNLSGSTVVHMSTTSAEYSSLLRDAVLDAGGRYVEASVSGSRIPAETGRLVAMVAGEPEDIGQVMPVLSAMCQTTVICGAVPAASRMKLAVNTFLISMVTGLAEAVAFAAAHRLDLHALAAILDGGPMASDVSTTKLTKLLSGELTAQAAAADVLKNCRLAVAAAPPAVTPLLRVCLDLYAETVELGYGAADMASVIKAIEARATRT